MTVGGTDAESSANGLLVNIGKRLPDESSVLERPNCQPSAGYGGPGRACIAFLPGTASCGEPRRRTLAVTLDVPNATVGEMPLLMPDRRAHMYHVVPLVRLRGTPGDAAPPRDARLGPCGARPKLARNSRAGIAPAGTPRPRLF